MRILLANFKKLRLINPVKFWLITTLLVFGLGWLGFFTYARNATISRQLNYPPCQIDYGQSLGSWDGSGSSEWDDENYHYEVKKFSLSSNLPAGIWANVKEDPPTRISSGSANGKNEACQPNFDNLVDTTAAAYRWQGARSVGLRLGAPNLKDKNNDGEFEPVNLVSRLRAGIDQAVFASHAQNAAAWVDDGGQASIKSTSAKAGKLLWCANNSQPLNPQERCGDITAQPAKAGAGYLFAPDNCPEAGGVNCQQAGSWLSGDPEFTKLIGTNSRGEVNPFNLYLDAVSTYGHGVGTGMLVTFKYSRISEVSNQLSLNKKVYNPGEVLKADIALGKLGPDLKDFTIKTDIEGQPLETTKSIKASEQTLAKLNDDESVRLSGQYRVRSNAQPGSCYRLKFSFSAQSQVEVKANTNVSIPELSQRYCIAQPDNRVVYQYSVTTRGQVQANLAEFKSLAAQTLASNLGWRKAGVSFKEVASGGDFSLVLASPAQMTSFSSGCDATYSCQVGRYVIINDERWREATPAWNNAGGSLRDYRHMVINHESGHWLGFGHLNCPKAGSPAPVMQQQSISLQGCKFSPWPSAAEIASLKSRV